MNRRTTVTGIASGLISILSGCNAGAFSGTDGRVPADDVFNRYWYDRTDLVVEFRENIDVETVVLYDSSPDETYETVDNPPRIVRFPVVFPDRMETYATARSVLRLRAETPDGWARQSVWEPIHGVARNVEPLSDGRARLGIENQGRAPLLVQFVGIYGDVPNPTVNPQRDSVDRSSFETGAGVIGVGENQPLSPPRTDLVVAPGETVPVETTYAPFSFPSESQSVDCTGGERTGTIAIVQASGGSNAYGFTYRLDGDPALIADEAATVCDVGE